MSYKKNFNTMTRKPGIAKERCDEIYVLTNIIVTICCKNKRKQIVKDKNTCMKTIMIKSFVQVSLDIPNEYTNELTLRALCINKQTNKPASFHKTNCFLDFLRSYHVQAFLIMDVVQLRYNVIPKPSLNQSEI